MESVHILETACGSTSLGKHKPKPQLVTICWMDFANKRIISVIRNMESGNTDITLMRTWITVVKTLKTELPYNLLILLLAIYSENIVSM